LLAWFNRRIQEVKKREKTNQTHIESLRLLRDALIAASKVPHDKRRPNTGRRKSG
jgi:hypothetical protein